MAPSENSVSSRIWKECRQIYRNLDSIGHQLEKDYKSWDLTIGDLNRYFEPKHGRPVTTFHDIVDVLSMRRSRTAVSQIYLQEKDFDRLETLLGIYDRINQIHNQLTNDVIKPIHREFHPFFVTPAHSAMFDQILRVVQDAKKCLASLEEDEVRRLPRVAQLSTTKQSPSPHERLWQLYSLVQNELHVVFQMLEAVERWRSRHPAGNPPDRHSRYGHDHCVFPAIDYANTMSHGWQKPESSRRTVMSRHATNRHACKSRFPSSSDPEMNPHKWERSLRYSQPAPNAIKPRTPYRPFTRLGGTTQKGGYLIGSYVSGEDAGNRHHASRMGNRVPLLWSNMPYNKQQKPNDTSASWNDGNQYADKSFLDDFDSSVLKITKWDKREPPQTARRLPRRPQQETGCVTGHRVGILDSFRAKPSLSQPRYRPPTGPRPTEPAQHHLFTNHNGFSGSGGWDESATTTDDCDDQHHSGMFVSRETGRLMGGRKQGQRHRQTPLPQDTDSGDLSTPRYRGGVATGRDDLEAHLRSVNEKISRVEHRIGDELAEREGLRRKIIDPMRWQVQQNFDWLKVIYRDKEGQLGNLQNRLDRLKNQRTTLLSKHGGT